MKENTGKLFLLSSAGFENHDENRDLHIETMQAFLKSGPGPGGKRTLLDHPQVFHKESAVPADLSGITSVAAVDMAREFSLWHVDDFDAPACEPGPAPAGIRVTKLEHHLFHDSHAFFCLVTEVEMAYARDLPGQQALSAIFHERRMFDNLGIRACIGKTRDAACAKVAELVSTPAAAVAADRIRFRDDDTLPFIMFADAGDIDRRHFGNEEIIASVRTEEALAGDYPGAFFYPGWNYTVASRLPREVLLNLLQMMLAAQAFYASLGYLKAYFSRELARTVRYRNRIGRRHVDTAEEVQLAFYNLLARFNTYRNHLFPKYHDELDRLMHRWHCDCDIEDIKEYIELNIQAKQRIQSASIELQNKRQNQALTFIALVQIISIYGAFTDGVSLFLHRWMVFAAGTLTWMACLLVYWLVTRRH